nr:MAG TPA: hypothetical protein [Bacteriophage sp.]DAX15212.1 MAG TPA: hypothetical protein [Bacteriophage sp.]
MLTIIGTQLNYKHKAFIDYIDCLKVFRLRD